MSEHNINNLTPEMIMKAKECKTPGDLVDFAKNLGIDITIEEAEAYQAEMADLELDEKTLKAIAGGGSINACYMIDGCAFKCGTLKDC